MDAAPTHYPTASAAALPEQEPKETQRVEAELQTYPPDQVAGTRQAELAWHLAACRLGMDCSAQGALMTAWCAHGGICPRRAHQDFEELLHAAEQPHGGEETIKQLSDSLLREGVLR